MSDTVVAALIGVGGAVLVAISGVITQFLITKKVIEAERNRVIAQSHTEDLLRHQAKRHDQILDSLSELLMVSDPMTAALNARRASNLIIRLQLLLDLKIPVERELNGELNQLGLILNDYVSLRAPTELERRDVLRVHSRVVDIASALLKQPHSNSLDSYT